MIINHLKPVIKKLFAACALAFIVFALFAPVKIVLAAAGDCTPGTKGCDYEPLTTIPGAFDQGKATDPVKVITNIYGVAIGIAAVLAVGMITWAGIQYATTEAVTGKSDAKGHWEGAIWGLVILLGSYIMLRTINVDLVNLNLDLKPLPPTSGKVGGNPLLDLQKAVEDSATSAAKSTTDVNAIQQNAQAKAASVQATVDSLTQQLASSTLSTSDKVALQNKLTYAQTILSFDKASAQRATTAQEVSKATASGNFDGAKSGLSSFIFSVRNDLSALNSTSIDSMDSTTGNAITQRIKDLTDQKNELDYVNTLVNVESGLYGRAINIYSSAKPSKPGLTTAQFQQELLVDTIYDSNTDVKDSPAAIIKKAGSKVSPSHPEIAAMSQGFTSGYLQGINDAIKKRVECYDSFLKQGSVPSTCTPFNNG